MERLSFGQGTGQDVEKACYARRIGIACPDICSERILDMERENSRLSYDLEYLSAKGSPRGHLTIPTLFPHWGYNPSFYCGEDLEGANKSQGWSPL